MPLCCGMYADLFVLRVCSARVRLSVALLAAQSVCQSAIFRLLGEETGEFLCTCVCASVRDSVSVCVCGAKMNQLYSADDAKRTLPSFSKINLYTHTLYSL